MDHFIVTCDCGQQFAVQHADSGTGFVCENCGTVCDIPYFATLVSHEQPLFAAPHTVTGFSFLDRLPSAPILIGGGVVGSGLFLFDTMQTLPDGNKENAGRLLVCFLAFFFGLLALAGSLRNWGFFMNSQKSKALKLILGDTGTRLFYALVGVVFLSFFFWNSVSSARQLIFGRQVHVKVVPLKTAPANAAKSAESGRLNLPPGSPQNNFGAAKIDPANFTMGSFLDPIHLDRSDSFHSFTGNAKLYVVTTNGQPLEPKTVRAIDVYDSATQDLMRLPSKDTVLRAVSPDLSRLALTSSEIGFDSIQVFQNHRGWTLEKSLPVPTSPYELSICQFIDDSHLLFCNGDGVLRLWEFPTGNVVYENQLGICGLTPGQHFALQGDPDGQSLHFINVMTGKPEGTMRTSSVFGIGSRIVMSMDGRKLASIHFSGGHHCVHILDVASGELLNRIPLEHPQGKLTWLNDDFLSWGVDIISLPKQSRVAQVIHTSDLIPSPNGQLWSKDIVRSEGNGFFVDALFCFDRQVFSQLVGNCDSTHVTIMQPNESVKLEMIFRATPPDAEIKQQIIELMQNQLTAAGFSLADNSANILQVLVTDDALGDNVTFSKGTVRFEDRGIASRNVFTPSSELVFPNRRLRLAISLSKGNRILWQSNIDYPTKLLLEEDIQLNFLQTVTTVSEKFIQAQRWERVQRSLGSVAIPNQFYDYSTAQRIQCKVAFDPNWAARPEWWPNLSTVPKQDLPLRSEPRKWDFSPQPAGLASNYLKKPLALGKGQVEELKFSAPPVGQAIVHLLETGNRSSRLFRCDLLNERIIATTDLPEGTVLMDFRPDGRTFLTCSGGKQLQVWKCGEDKDEIYLNVPQEDEQTVSTAYFVGSTGLVVSDGLQVRLYELPGGQVRHQWEGRIRRDWLTWDRSHYLDIVDGRFALIDSTSGAVKGELERYNSYMASRRTRSSLRGLVQDAAIQPNGYLLAVLLGSTCVLWDLRTGELVKSFDILDQGGRTLRWTSSNHMLWGETLFDTRQGLPVWTYSGIGSFYSPDGAEYYSPTDTHGVNHLAATIMPSQAVIDAVKRMLQKSDIAPDKTATLEFEIYKQHPRPEQLKEQLRDIFETKFAEQGIQISDGQKTCIIVKVDVDEDNQQSLYRIRCGDKERYAPKEDLNLQLLNKLSSNVRSEMETAVARVTDIDYELDPNVHYIESSIRQQQERYLLKRLQQMNISLLKVKNRGRYSFGSLRLTIDGDLLNTVLPDSSGDESK